jgi:hypothetical protein
MKHQNMDYNSLPETKARAKRQIIFASRTDYSDPRPRTQVWSLARPEAIHDPFFNL